MGFEELLADEAVRGKLIATVACVAAVLVIRVVLGRLIRSLRWHNDTDRLAWLSRIRWLTLIAIAAGVFLVWATEIQSLALSAVAIAAAIVLATKELILCMSGGFVRKVGGSFRVGDRIEIGGFRGDVVDHGILTTTLLEIGPGHQRTGRAVTLPNSLLVSQAVVNETYTDEYVLHVVTVPLDEDDDWAEAERVLLATAESACKPHLEQSRIHMEKQAEQHGLSPPSVEPRVLLQLDGAKSAQLLVRFPAPARDKSRLEQEVVRAFSAWRTVTRGIGGPTAAEDPPAPSA